MIRAGLPILERTLAGGLPLVYLDSANTSQKPQVVIDTMVDHLSGTTPTSPGRCTSWVRRRPEAFEAARQGRRVHRCPSRNEVVFTKNATEALNLLARTIDLGPGDNVVITEMEHHSNLVPRQLACERSVPSCGGSGSPTTVAWTCRTPTGSSTSTQGGRVHLGLQHARHHQPGGDLAAGRAPWARSPSSTPRRPRPAAAGRRPSVGCDFLVFTGHRSSARPASACCGDREELLNELPPFHGGGEMIETVTMARSTYARAPPLRGRHPADRRGGRSRAAVDYLSHIGLDAIHRHEQTITAYALEGLATVPGLTVLGPLDAAERGERSPSRSTACTPRRSPGAGLARRRGPCGPPLRKPAHARFGVQSSTRMSSYLYTTPAGRSTRWSTAWNTPARTSSWGERCPRISTRCTRRSSWTTTRTPTTRAAEPFEAEVHHVNPTCGDEVTLRVHVAQGVVEDVSYDAVGLLDLAGVGVGPGRPRRRQAGRRGDVDPRELPDPHAGQGAPWSPTRTSWRTASRSPVSPSPARVKCALLSWMAWKDATARSRRRAMADHSDLPEVPEATGGVGTSTVTVDDVTEAMKDVVDPELGINVVDLGLVYDVHLDEGSTASST